jgi:hypothetical protein
VSDGDVTELVLFKLKDGVTEAEYLAASEEVMESLRGLDGYRSRRLLKGEDGWLADLVSWSSMEAALAAAEVFATLPCAARLIAAIDESTMTMLHLEPVQVWDEVGAKP